VSPIALPVTAGSCHHLRPRDALTNDVLRSILASPADPAQSLKSLASAPCLNVELSRSESSPDTRSVSHEPIEKISNADFSPQTPQPNHQARSITSEPPTGGSVEDLGLSHRRGREHP